MKEVLDIIEIREIKRGDTFIECGTAAHLIALKIFHQDDRAEVVARVIKGDRLLKEGEIVNYMQKYEFSAYAPRVILRSRIKGLQVIQGGK